MRPHIFVASAVLLLLDACDGPQQKAGAEKDKAEAVAAGQPYIYWIVSTMISLAAGSYAAARVAGAHDRFGGLIHGLTIWGLTSILTVYLVTSAVGGIIGGAFRTVGGVASAASQSRWYIIPGGDRPRHRRRIGRASRRQEVVVR